MPSREGLILGQRQTSEARASSPLDYHMSKQERRGPTERPTPRSHQISGTGIVCDTTTLGVPPMIQASVRPSIQISASSFKSRCDYWAVLAVRNGSSGRREIQGHANVPRIRSLLLAGSDPACTSWPACPACPPVLGMVATPKTGRGRLLEWLGDALMHRLPCSTKRGVMRDGFRLFPKKIHRFFLLAISTGHLSAE